MNTRSDSDPHGCVPPGKRPRGPWPTGSRWTRRLMSPPPPQRHAAVGPLARGAGPVARPRKVAPHDRHRSQTLTASPLRLVFMALLAALLALALAAGALLVGSQPRGRRSE